MVTLTGCSMYYEDFFLELKKLPVPDYRRSTRGYGAVLGINDVVVHNMIHAPKKGAKDLRKNRSIMNNIILTTTGAAKALRLVIPEMAKIGFIAESVRIPTVTGSLIILVMNFQEDFQKDPIRRDLINSIYKNTAEENPNQYLLYTDKQNVSSDIIGQPYAAAIIEGHETHTRTGAIDINLEQVKGIEKDIMDVIKNQVASIQVTQAVIYAWYDNEMGSYANILGDRTASIASVME